ncbi:hypothetical protein PSI9734_01648 [Pseudidiomarina piscicola]|uniref:N-formylglutamate amidohydrolase n=1 Tax=Pseudidiomarina piscicola TaxID=2614830 RepID=A0A6S6WN13_9GAMM|nr:N-formylglutamate amidohydrolase [Pseudidiomarina piscicola]CAB0151235.1 hypothetical protein PSI9734_01648 [Pseudidiomarina piscicola]VZT40741.1 hypothetical protein PSI9734_01648 [Pseudomonas aeruginosa]
MPYEKAYTMHLPLAGRVQPLVIDSPHSSCWFPPHPALAASDTQLKTGWDAFVDELWLPSVGEGATLLAANFSRMFIDPNRAASDIDEALLAENWPYALQPTPYSARGMGLIRRFALPQVPMYSELLTVDDVRQRIATYYEPYHQALAQRLRNLRDEFGAVWHIDCHSMKSTGNAMNIDAGAARPDVVVSDGCGTTAAPEFTAMVVAQFERLGFRAAANDPYQGGHIVRNYGAPKLGVHSIQIELNRALYMHEASFEKSAKFVELQQQLSLVTEAILEYINTHT